MKKKICPYCDQVMKHSCYCGFCRRVVLHPKEQEINYYLNERHPRHEEDCSYHGSLPGEQEAGNRAASAGGKRPAPARPSPAKSAPASTTSVSASQTARTKSAAKKTSPSLSPMPSPKPVNAKGRQKWASIKVVLVIYIISMVLGGLGKFRENFRSTRTSEPENVAANLRVSTSPDDAAYGWETERYSWERTDEQVKEAGIACNAYGHLPVEFEELSSEITGQLAAADYLISPWSRWSSNQDQDSYTSFNTYYDCDVSRADKDCGVLSLLYDTATEELHGVVLYSEDQDEIRQISECVINAFRSQGTLSDGIDAGQTINSLFENAQEDVIMLLEAEGLEITLRIYSYEDYKDYGISFYAAGYYTDPS